MGREIMVYPTFPKWDGAINNTLISEGAILVEDADDIKREIYNN
jgi:predicted Rossmann fold nucleotide-binding protein DprA/Smf involved in DNA uptake